MPGCSAALATAAASMTGPTDVGPIQPALPEHHQAPLLDDGLFDEPPDEQRGAATKRRLYAAPRPDSRARRRASSAVSGLPVQLTPLWEYVVRTKKFPKDADVQTIFEEIVERLRDPEWEVRQHALRVLVDVLPTLSAEVIDDVADITLADLVENLGNPAPAVRKGSLDALRIYLLHSPRRDEVTLRILRDGMNRADVLDEYQTSVATGVILSTPLILFPSRSCSPPAVEVVREATRALALRLVQVTHQDSALRSLVKIRESIGDHEFESHMAHVDDSIRRNFDLLCDVYGIGVPPNTVRRRSKSKTSSKHVVNKSPLERKDSVEESIRDVVPLDKSWESDDSDTSGIAEEEEDAVVARNGSGGSVTSARVVLETEIKFNEETAITMTILEEQEKELGEAAESDGSLSDDENEDENDDQAVKAIEGPIIEEIDAPDMPEDRRKTPRRVHFGGEIVKLRTPDSEDTESVISDRQQPTPPPPPTKIPLPVSPATRLPPQQPRRARSSGGRGRRNRERQRRSASTSPRREIYTHNANLSPKKSILTKNSELIRRRSSSADRSYEGSRISRRDSFSPVSSPRVVIQEIEEDPLPEERSFRVYGEPPEDRQSPEPKAISPKSPSPSLLGDVCTAEEPKTHYDIERVFGDRSGYNFQEKMRKDHENMMRSVYRSTSAQDKTIKFDWDNEDYSQGKDRRRSQSAKSPGFEVFPRQERNYILMELSSPTKDLSRRSSLQDDSPVEQSPAAGEQPIEKTESKEPTDFKENQSEIITNEVQEKKTEEIAEDSNKLAAESDKVQSEPAEEETDDMRIDEDEIDVQLDGVYDDFEKSALDAKERSSDSSSDGDWKNKEPNWEELGLVDAEILTDFHNKEDWRAKVRGLERIASAFRAPSSLQAVEPRLGSLLHAVLGGERSCRVAAAGMTVAKVVLTGVNEEALTNRLALIAWGLARQGGPNAASLARLAMLRTSPGLFVEKLLQPQCIGARNAKMRENTLQLLIFSLVTFPSTEFKVKTAIDKVVAMVGDRRKRVRLSALETLAVLSQIYDTEEIVEASKRFTKNKQDGQSIHAAIKTRLCRRLLPTVSVDGLVVYGLQISSNSLHTGADVDWIAAGSGSVSPGTGRTRGQLIAMSKMEDEQNDPIKKLKSRPASEHSISSANVGGLEKDERTSSWKLLPQLDQDDEEACRIKLKKTIRRTSKSADISKVPDFGFNSSEVLGKETKNQRPYATPKRYEKKVEQEATHDIKVQTPNCTEEYSTQNSGNVAAPSPERAKLESRIPIYTGDRITSSKVTDNNEMSGDNRELIREKSSINLKSPKDNSQGDNIDSNGYLSLHQKRKLQALKSAAPRINYGINQAYSNNYKHQSYERGNEELDSETQTKFDNTYKTSSSHGYKENNIRAYSYEKLNKGFDTVIKNSRAGLRSVPHYQYSSKVTESYESIYQRQRRLKDEKGVRAYEVSSSPPTYGYEYEGYYSNNVNKNNQAENMKNTKDTQSHHRSSQKRQYFVSPFDSRPSPRSAGIFDKATEPETDSASERNGANSGRSAVRSANFNERTSLPRHAAADATETRSNSGSSLSSNRSTTSGRKLRGSGQTLAAHTESEESNAGVDADSRASSTHHHQQQRRYDDKAFDVISAKSNPSRRLSPEEELDDAMFHDARHTSAATSKSRRSAAASDTSSEQGSADSAALRKSAEHSLESVSPGGNGPPPAYNGYADEPLPTPPPTPVKSRPASRCSSGRAYSARGSSPSRSMATLNGVSGDADDREPSESPEEEDTAFETLDFRNAARQSNSGKSMLATSRPHYDYDNDLRNTDSNVTLYSCTSNIASPKSSSPRRYASEELRAKDTDSDETPPLPIGFDDAQQSSDDDSDEVDDAKPQPSRMPTPVDLPRKLLKVSPCKMRPQTNCHRATSVPATRHHEKHEKLSRAVQHCFVELESKDWEVTLKGLKKLSQLARDEPEQLDACAPGSLARLLGKHVKNLRSQVARVACTAVGELFAAHVRGIDQDLDELAAPLLHRTADTNRFLREDCNAALNSMIEHVPPHRTIITIANRGASHQNTIVHATTARLLHVIVSDIGPDHVMFLPRDVKDKLFATTAKLLTDGNLQARKHAKETFRLLSRCEGFRKSLTDAVPESTLRLIEKTLRTL